MQKLLAQIMKFGVVGIVATVIDFGIMNLLHYGPMLWLRTCRSWQVVERYSYRPT